MWTGFFYFISNMKKYELRYTIGDEGVYRMSTVESPAIKTTLVMFDDELKALEFQDEEKQVIYSVAMRPNMLIPRKNINGEPAMVFYTEETVEALQQNFFKNGSNLGATINHDGKVRKDMYIFESWIVTDAEKDKAGALGLDVKMGDWVVGQKIENPEIWQKVKNKELTGFSIEAFLEPVLINNKVEMTQEEVDARIKRVLMESQLGTEYVVGENKYYIDKLEVGGVVTDGDGVPVPNTEITIDTTEIKTDDKGVILEVITEQEMEGPAQPVEDKTAEMQKTIDDQATEINDLKAKIVELEGGNVKMSAELEATKKVALEMAQEVKIPAAPEKVQKAYHEMSNAEKVKFNRGK